MVWGIGHQRWIGHAVDISPTLPQVRSTALHTAPATVAPVGRLAGAGQPLPRSRSIQLLSSGLDHPRPQTYTTLHCVTLHWLWWGVQWADQGGQLTGQTPILRTASRLSPPLFNSQSTPNQPPRSTLQECLRKIVPAQCLLFLLGWAFWEIHSISLQICKGGYPLKLNTNIMGFYSLSVKPYIQMCKLTCTWIEVLHQHVSIQKTKHGTAVQLNPV